jgi:hypothetical protein
MFFRLPMIDYVRARVPKELPSLKDISSYFVLNEEAPLFLA